MPEGPSIVILAEKMAYLKHKVVLEATGYADLDMDAFSHKKIMDFRTWGKHFLICFNDFSIRIHLGLFGSYQFQQPKKVNPKIAFHFSGDDVYFYVCTVKRIDEPLDAVYDWSSDVMSEKWSSAKALQKLEKIPTQQICDALLDQQIFSGVGNIIKNEVLYRCKVHPESLVGKIPATRLKAIVKECRQYSFDFLNWKKKNELSKNFQVYEQKRSRVSGLEVTRKDTGRGKRSSYFVPGLQKLYL